MVWRKKREGRREISTSEEFIKAVVKEVKFAWDRPKISEELKAHIEDLEEEFQSDGSGAEQVRQQAIAAMGDARQVGRALNKEHHFVLGWLWLATRVILIFLMVGSLFYAASVWDGVHDWNQQGKTIRELESENISYSVRKLDRKVEMKHCTLELKSLIRTETGEIGGYLIYSVKKHWRDGNFIKAERIEAVADKEKQVAHETPSLVWNVKGRSFWRQYRGTITLEQFPADAKALYLGYHMFGEDWDLKIPLEGVGEDA